MRRFSGDMSSAEVVVGLVKPEERIAREIDDLRARIPDTFADIEEPLLRDLKGLNLLLLAP